MSEGNRVVQITLQKCGSQWVRDVLSAPEIVIFSQKPHSRVSLRVGSHGEISIPENTYSGPIYGMNAWEWQHWRRQGDRALVILRDPRDMLISQMFSLLYSHGSSVIINYGRRQLHALPSERERLERLTYQFVLSGNLRTFLTWSNSHVPSAKMVRYEDLIANELMAFEEIIDWLEWPVPREVLQNVVNRLSFEQSTGRKPGESDKFSHHRKGLAGDWRNYFTVSMGEFWESLMPGFLSASGYESRNDWWQNLPEALSSLETIRSESPSYLEVIERQLRANEQQLVEKERSIQSLSMAAQEIQQQLHEKEAVIEKLSANHVGDKAYSQETPVKIGLISRWLVRLGDLHSKSKKERS